jgi:hypothetical protein
MPRQGIDFTDLDGLRSHQQAGHSPKKEKTKKTYQQKKQGRVIIPTTCALHAATALSM